MTVFLQKSLLPTRGVVLMLFLLSGTGVLPVFGAGELSIGDQVPEVSLEDLEGKKKSFTDFRGKPFVALFGELYNKNTLSALDDIVKVLSQPPLEGKKVSTALVLGVQASREEIRRDWKSLKKGDSVQLLHDKPRLAFETFQVKVLPTLVVADAEGRLVIFMSGYPLNFSDLVTDGVLYALGEIGRERLERGLHPVGTADPGRKQLQALRKTRMAAALAKRNLSELALEGYREALSLDPSLMDARLGLATLQLELGRVQEAHTLFMEVLEKSPENLKAHIGLARIEIKRDQLPTAEKRLETQAALHPLEPQLHFLLGEVYEKSDRKDEALSAYKKAAILFLKRYGS